MNKDGENHPRFFEVRNCIAKCMQIDRGTATNLTMGLSESEIDQIYNGELSETEMMDLMTPDKVVASVAPMTKQHHDAKNAPPEPEPEPELEPKSESESDPVDPLAQPETESPVDPEIV